jgi:hypothetical protein
VGAAGAAGTGAAGEIVEWFMAADFKRALILFASGKGDPNEEVSGGEKT